MSSEENPRAFKHLLGPELLSKMAKSLGKVWPDFDQDRLRVLMPELNSLELKGRVRRIREELRALLPPKFPAALRILLRSVEQGDLQGFDLWPYSEFVQIYGIHHCAISLNALRSWTPLFSSEFAVRPFLILYPTSTLNFLKRCAQDARVDLRRWASEGSRPRLPWGERLQEFIRDPSATGPILEILKFDPEVYVRKSVANHLNDIAKDHPELVIRTLSRWKKEAGSTHAEKIGWTIRHSLRTLIKRGDPAALRLMGVSTRADFKLSKFKVDRRGFKLGDRVAFGFTLKSRSDKPQKVIVDYIIHFMKANRTRTVKVFKLKTIVLPPGGEIQVAKHHVLKKVTTRVHYSGVHWLEVQVNGKVLGRVQWNLSV